MFTFKKYNIRQAQVSFVGHISLYFLNLMRADSLDTPGINCIYFPPVWTQSDLRCWMETPPSACSEPWTRRRWVCSWSWRTPSLCPPLASQLGSTPAPPHSACAETPRGSTPWRAVCGRAAERGSTRWWRGSPPVPTPSPRPSEDAPEDTCCGNDPRPKPRHDTAGGPGGPNAEGPQGGRRTACP